MISIPFRKASGALSVSRSDATPANSLTSLPTGKDSLNAVSEDLIGCEGRVVSDTYVKRVDMFAFSRRGLEGP